MGVTVTKIVLNIRRQFQLSVIADNNNSKQTEITSTRWLNWRLSDS